MASSTLPPSKKPKLAYHHKHRLTHPPPPSTFAQEPALLSKDAVDYLVYNSIKTICEEAAFHASIEDPAIESVALESLRGLTETYLSNLCSKIRRSMQASRRTVPIPPDFESAFYAVDVPRLDDQLAPYKTIETWTPPALLPTPPPDDDFHNIQKLPDGFLGAELSRQDELRKFGFNTTSLPPLPSAHTYRNTEVKEQRETDSRKIRELATEEGKLGEQALRKLAGAVKLESALAMDSEERVVKSRRRGGGPSQSRRKKDPVLTEEAMFEQTMMDLLKGEGEGANFELGPIVSSEKKYRMPDEGKVRKRPVTVRARKDAKDQSETGLDIAPPPIPTLKTEASKYNLLPPMPGKAQVSASEEMDIEL